MLKLIISGLLTSIILVLVSCAPPPPALPIDIQTEADRETGIDSLESAQYDEMFVEIHTVVLKALEEAEKNDLEENIILETRAIVQIAEECYLEGNPLLAIKLLTEAELLLRQTP
ncbi:MAG: hypothetical protein JXB45_10450 [Candidatus Krumholzibacteriota bacterium]|nr:hypothetical protein [Candidatus Krumholzibacteriota bacterium]